METHHHSLRVLILLLLLDAASSVDSHKGKTAREGGTIRKNRQLFFTCLLSL